MINPDLEIIYFYVLYKNTRSGIRNSNLGESFLKLFVGVFILFFFLILKKILRDGKVCEGNRGAVKKLLFSYFKKKVSNKLTKIKEKNYGFQI